MKTYDEVIARKSRAPKFSGVDPGDLDRRMFPHQVDLVRWALRRGRAAIFADTGLGKTFMELEWSRAVSKHGHGRVLILAPLAVAQQTVREGARYGIDVRYLRADDGTSPLVITNYDMLHAFDADDFVGVVLDESSILKSYDGRTRTELTRSFAQTPYRLACTATPAPNDHTELGNHSEFLGLKTRAEMLAEFFVHDGGSVQDWRIKGHAIAPFWRWVATWGAVVKRPSDLGHDDGDFSLPPLRAVEHVIPMAAEDVRASGMLFAADARTLAEQRAVRRGTISKRAAQAAEIAGLDEPCVVWCELNDEADACADLIPGAVQVSGSDDLDEKEERLLAFSSGAARVMVSKPKICGHGLNWQHCARVVFVGASHSYEQTYQAIRRCWRFGQRRPVEVHFIRADAEEAVVRNYHRKEADAERMAEEMTRHVVGAVRSEVRSLAREWNEYDPRREMLAPEWIGEDR